MEKQHNNTVHVGLCPDSHEKDGQAHQGELLVLTSSHETSVTE